MMDLQILVAPLAAFSIGLVAAWHFKSKTSDHQERTRDLRESHKAMVAHFEAMDRIIASEVIDIDVKAAFIKVTRHLGNRGFANRVCAAVSSKSKIAKTESKFGRAVENIRADHPEAFKDIETAMATSLFVLMLRWPETAQEFKRFVVSSMINDEREAMSFSRVSAIANQQDDKGPDVSNFLDACAA